MINKLLITCLQRNKRLVLPTLGAFIRKNIDGVGVVLVFVPFLHKDDGVLHAAIKSWAGVEDEEATQILTEYIAAIKRSLDERGKYNIEGVGILKYDINNIVSLAKEESEDLAPKADLTAQQPDSNTTTATDIPTENRDESATTAPAAPVTPIAPAAPVMEQLVEQPIEQPIEQPVVPTAPTAPITEVPVEQKPISNTPNYNSNLYQKPTDMGTRYFSPERDYQTLVNSNDRFSKGNNYPINEPQTATSQPQQPAGSNMSSRADVTSTFNRQRTQSRISDLYESKSAPQQNQSQRDDRNEGSRAATLRTGGNGKVQTRRRKPIKKGKNNDMVLIIAIIAIVLTVIVLIYGYMHGGEQSLDSLEVYDPVEVTTSDTIQ